MRPSRPTPQGSWSRRIEARSENLSACRIIPIAAGSASGKDRGCGKSYFSPAQSRCLGALRRSHHQALHSKKPPQPQDRPAMIRAAPISRRLRSNCPSPAHLLGGLDGPSPEPHPTCPHPVPANILTPLIVACALFMENLDGTVISTSLPAIAADLGEDPIALKLALTSYLLSLAIFIPASGWAADRFGARTVFRP